MAVPENAGTEQANTKELDRDVKTCLARRDKRVLSNVQFRVQGMFDVGPVNTNPHCDFVYRDGRLHLMI